MRWTGRGPGEILRLVPKHSGQHLHSTGAVISISRKVPTSCPLAGQASQGPWPAIAILS